MDIVSYEIFYKHRDILLRYLELIKNDKQDKIETSLVIISRSIQDINRQIKAYNQGENGVGVFYQLVIKTDILIESIKYLFEYFLKSDGLEIYDGVKDIIKEFKLIRSLSIAHPLLTTRYKEFGFGNENEKWC